MYSLSFDKINVVIACYDDIFGRHSINKAAMITSTHNLLLPSLI